MNRNKVPQFSVRLPLEQYSWFVAYCESSGLSKNSVVCRALEVYRDWLEQQTP